MAELLPNNFPIPQENAIASYDYTDVASGTGYIIFYGCNSQTGYFLIDNTNVYSDDINQETTGATGAYPGTLRFDLTFDVTFNTPRVVNGKLYANIPHFRTATGSAAAYCKVYAIHYDGTTETALDNGEGTAIVWTSSSQTFDKPAMANVEMDISNQKFKAGETLRFDVEVYSYGGSDAGQIYVGHDPPNREGKFSIVSGSNFPGTSQMSFHVPFKIDI